MNINAASSVVTNNVAKQAESGGFLGSIGDVFGEILDVVNPLQHIPIISNLYREFTGDSIGTVANIAGGALFGGPMGAAGAAASEIINAGLNDESTTQTALVDTQKATESYTKLMRVTTQDWLNPNFDMAA